MNTYSHSFANRNIETATIKKAGGFTMWMLSLPRSFKLRSSRGYGSHKSAYYYYLHNS
ncbi:MAG: hypothetical protein ACI9H6_000045 [Patiriisocius sp.]|jgi:hypothetical protein